MIDYFYLQYLMNNRKLKEAGMHPLLRYLLGIVAFILLSEYLFQKTAFAELEEEMKAITIGNRIDEFDLK